MQRIPIGYRALVDVFNLKVMPNYCWSYISRGAKREILEDGQIIQIFPKSYAFEDFKNPFLHLEFALKYEGLNLEIISQVFERLDTLEFELYVQAEPLGKPQRKLWYIYELLVGKKLNISDLTSGNYLDLLSSEDYYVCAPIKSPRHRINDNLLGNGRFCPFIRKTDKLSDFENMHFDKKSSELLGRYQNYVVRRAIRYLYLEETTSTWQIEREMPSSEKEARFRNALQQAFSIKDMTKQELVGLQNIIFEPRYASSDYRKEQIFVGKIDRYYRPDVHYIPPKPQDVTLLMDALLASLERMLESDVNPVIIAAAISFGFVFIHPFQDGNGRIHRFLIHYILSKKKFVSHDMIFPISAIMLNNLDRYILVLESFSDNLMTILDYKIEDNKVIVGNNFYSAYAYADYTRFAQYLFECIELAVNQDLLKELKFVENYDKVKLAIQNVVDMPDRHIDLIIKIILQNNGVLPTVRREKHFGSLTDFEVSQIEAIVKEFML